MKNYLDHVDIPRLKKFVDSQNTASMVSPDDYVAEFLSNYKAWKDVVGCILGGDGRDENDGEWLYGNALIIYSSSLYGSSKNLTKGNVDLLKNELFDYEDKVRSMYEIKGLLYFNLVRCLHKLSLASDDELKEYLKGAMYYFISMGNNISYKVDCCYAYRSANDYLIKSLKEEKLSMSSPTTFNDPFDCPILEFLNLYGGEDVYKLVSKALSECLKITCFVNNTVLQSGSYEEGIPKHYNDPEEYLSELMWGHYADKHRGVCIKYHFNNDITKFADEKKRQIVYFRDVKYTSDMDAYRKNGVINLYDAFFVKGKAWEYENELRLLAYDPKGSGKSGFKWWDKILRLFKRKRTGDYAYIDAKDCIAAVYFGLKCPKDKQDQIINILKGYKWVEKNIDGTKKIEHKVEFFRMEIDETQFGKLKAVKI